MASSVVVCCVRPTAHTLLCIVNGDDSAVFHFLSPVTLTFDPKFKLGRDFCTMHLTAKFHHPTFSRSKVSVRTNKLTGKQTPLKTSPRFAMLRRWVTEHNTYNLVQFGLVLNVFQNIQMNKQSTFRAGRHYISHSPILGIHMYNDQQMINSYC